ncbi:hypothetical protein LguiB_021790 [Lonicera macranthoides]
MSLRRWMMSRVRYQICILKYGSIPNMWLWNHPKRIKDEFLANFARLMDGIDFYAGILKILHHVSYYTPCIELIIMVSKFD